MKTDTFTIKCKPEDVVLLMTVSDGRLVTSLDVFNMVNDKRVKTVKVVIMRSNR